MLKNIDNNFEQLVNCGLIAWNNNNDAKTLKELATPYMNLQHTCIRVFQGAS